MAEFKDASLWMKIAFFFTTVGIVIICFAYASGMGGGSDDGEVACFVIGFLGVFTAFICIMLLVFFDEVQGNKIALIIFVVAAFVGGIMTVIGLALWGGRHDNNGNGNGNGNNNSIAYPEMLGALGSLSLILAAIMGILELVGVGAP